MAQILLGIPLLPEFVEFSEDGGCEHVLDVNSSGSLGVEEEEELPDGSHDVFIFEVIVHVFEVNKGRDELADVLIEVGLSQIAISSSIVQTDVNSGLEKVVLSDDGVEEGLHVDSAVLISVKFKESGC